MSRPYLWDTKWIDDSVNLMLLYALQQYSNNFLLAYICNFYFFMFVKISKNLEKVYQTKNRYDAGYYLTPTSPRVPIKLIWYSEGYLLPPQIALVAVYNE